MRVWKASSGEEDGSASSIETTDYKYLSVQFTATSLQISGNPMNQQISNLMP
jgi:hypothetical protein